MNLEDIKEAKEFYEVSSQIHKEFLELFEKWRKKDLRVTMVMTIHLPINLMINLIKNCDKEYLFSSLFEEFPYMFMRFFKPFEHIYSSWGIIPDKEFIEMYLNLYEKQYQGWFPDEKTFERLRKETDPYLKGKGLPDLPNSGLVAFGEEGFTPPPWIITDNEERTRGWCDHQKHLRGETYSLRDDKWTKKSEH